MSRLAILVVALGLVGTVGACDKPTPADCETALRNIQRLLGTENLATTAQLQSEVRRCTGGSSRAAVTCAINAKSIDDLNSCDFEKKGTHHTHELGSGSTGGSGSGS